MIRIRGSRWNPEARPKTVRLQAAMRHLLRGFRNAVAAGFGLLLLAPAPGLAATITYDFETDQSGSFTLQESGGPDAAADFSYDYSAMAIPSAPSGIGTTGLRIQVNMSLVAANSLTLYPDLGLLDLTTGTWSIVFDLWINVPSTAGFTLFGGFGARADTAEPGLGTDGSDGFNYDFTGDGGSSSDYRYYEGVVTQAWDNSKADYWGVNAADGSAAEWQSFFPSPAPFPGSPGEMWITVRLLVSDDGGTRQVAIKRVGDASFTVVSSLTGGVGDDSRPLIGMWDAFSSLGVPVDETFILFDNLVIDDAAVPVKLQSFSIE
jgi:hypothetical protein